MGYREPEGGAVDTSRPGYDPQRRLTCTFTPRVEDGLARVPQVGGHGGEIHDKHHERGGAAHALRADAAPSRVRERSGPARAHGSAAPAPPGQQQPRFLGDKLQIPQPHFPVLRRRRITGLIDQAARNRVTLVSGPAGAGKTVACATWAAAPAQARRVVWLTLDAEDQQAWFWAYVCAGLARLRPVPADVTAVAGGRVAGRVPAAAGRGGPDLHRAGHPGARRHPRADRHGRAQRASTC